MFERNLSLHIGEDNNSLDFGERQHAQDVMTVLIF